MESQTQQAAMLTRLITGFSRRRPLLDQDVTDA